MARDATTGGEVVTLEVEDLEGEPGRSNYLLRIFREGGLWECYVGAAIRERVPAPLVEYFQVPLQLHVYTNCACLVLPPADRTLEVKQSSLPMPLLTN